MRTEREGGRLLFYLTPQEFEAINDKFDNVDRISWDVLDQKGLMNLILDWPMGRIVAVLDPQECNKSRAVK